jgi:hypothetical protein
MIGLAQIPGRHGAIGRFGDTGEVALASRRSAISDRINPYQSASVGQVPDTIATSPFALVSRP